MKKKLIEYSRWTILIISLPLILSIANYIANPTLRFSELFVIASLIIASFAFIISRVKEVEDSLEELKTNSKEREKASNEIISSILIDPQWKCTNELFLACNKILKNDNPLMLNLAKDQITGLASFLKKFDKSLPFFPEHELITIEKHYSAFMEEMGNEGDYHATTFARFWFNEEDEILKGFFYTNSESANNGVRIKRVFLISAEDQKNPKVIGILKKHSEISNAEYANNGKIETKVLMTEIIDPDQDDFGIYFIKGEPKAVAIAKFYPETFNLKGNEVSFNPDIIQRKENSFHGKFYHKQAIDINEYLNIIDK